MYNFKFEVPKKLSKAKVEYLTHALIAQLEDVGGGTGEILPDDNTLLEEATRALRELMREIKDGSFKSGNPYGHDYAKLADNFIAKIDGLPVPWKVKGNTGK